MIRIWYRRVFVFYRPKAMALPAAALLLKPTPRWAKLQASPTNPSSEFHKKRNCSLGKILNDNRSSKDSQKISKKEESLFIDRRQAIVLVGLSWATSAMAIPNPYLNPKDGTQKILQGVPLTFNVGRPSRPGDEGGEEVLTVSVRVPRGEPCGFNVFIDLPDAQPYTSISCAQFAGTFFNEPNRLPKNLFRDTQLRVGIGDIIDELGLSKDPNLLVTIAPKLGSLQTPIVVKDVTVMFE